jgi:hypothetical protein
MSQHLIRGEHMVSGPFHQRSVLSVEVYAKGGSTASIKNYFIYSKGPLVAKDNYSI